MRIDAMRAGRRIHGKLLGRIIGACWRGGMRRRPFLGYGLTGACTALAPWLVQAEAMRSISIGTTPVFLDDDVAFLRDWQAYLQRELGRPVSFVQRRGHCERGELLV